ncbi:MAG: 30S ribosomal protein S8 [Clostridiales Family XIII bacterium]|nr:30S ribosomal protein S8 [Clostridiales Family XIII bacterium]
MTMTDPVADMLTRIRNANSVGHEDVSVPASRVKKSIAGILKDEGYINDFDLVTDDKQGVINIKMKYGVDNEKVISGIRKISKPGLRVYAKAEDVPRVLGGLGIAIISTSKGVISDKEARRLGVGGEVICYVW